MVLEFIKGHNNISIKDIALNINGCSEKTIQRELINLINDGKIKKTGERRWSRYSIS
jgi:DeoR/GlpR family transcriptional regulator of sugar metabolism